MYLNIIIYNIIAYLILVVSHITLHFLFSNKAITNFAQYNHLLLPAPYFIYLLPVIYFLFFFLMFFEVLLYFKPIFRKFNDYIIKIYNSLILIFLTLTVWLFGYYFNRIDICFYSITVLLILMRYVYIRMNVGTISARFFQGITAFTPLTILLGFTTVMFFVNTISFLLSLNFYFEPITALVWFFLITIYLTLLNLLRMWHFNIITALTVIFFQVAIIHNLTINFTNNLITIYWLIFCSVLIFIAALLSLIIRKKVWL